MKVGDRVRVVSTPYGNPKLDNGQLGDVAVVGDGYVGVVMDNRHEHLFDPTDLVWNFRNEQVEVAE